MKRFLPHLVLPLLLLPLLLAACTQPAGHPNRDHYTVIVSLDGFRWDYPLIHSTPFLDTMARRGVQAVMHPSYPASTFPNHYTMATGLVPDHHGIVNNAFWDPVGQRAYGMTDSLTRNDPFYYLGEPIWLTAQRQGVKTGNVYWVGSDIAVRGNHVEADEAAHATHYPTYHLVWADEPRLTFAQRVDETVRLLSLPEDERPRLVMTYFDEPDHNGHVYGPTGAETGQVVHELDSLMAVLWDGLQASPVAGQVNLIVTADHGMTAIADERFICVDDYIPAHWVEHVIGANPTSIFTRPAYRDSVLQALQGAPHLSVWRREDIPAELMYGSSERVGDVVVAPDLGWQFDHQPRHLLGAHGYEPSHADMQVAFRAMGPDFLVGHTATPFVNVDLYPLLAHLLGITPEPTDGCLDRVLGMLAEP